MEKNRINLIYILTLGLWPLIPIYFILRFTENNIWLAFVAYHVGCLIVPRSHIKRARFPIANWRSWILMVGITSALLLLAISAFTLWLAKMGLFTQEGMSALNRIQPWPLFGLYILIVNPILEEYYWRDYLQERAGLFLSTALFGLIHFPFYALFLGYLIGFVTCFSPFLLGLFWGWLFRRFDTLWPGIISHLAVNIAMFVIATLART